jgi:hypothetical protein
MVDTANAVAEYDGPNVYPSVLWWLPWCARHVSCFLEGLSQSPGRVVGGVEQARLRNVIARSRLHSVNCAGTTKTVIQACHNVLKLA